MPRTLVIVWFTAAVFVGEAPAQQKASGTGSSTETLLTRFVPDSTRIFIRVNNLREVDAAMKKAHAWQLLSLASGGQPYDVPEFDVRAVVGALLGSRSRLATAALMRTQVSLAARSWSELEGAVWYLRVPDERTLDLWFPLHRRRESRIARDARLIKMPGGVIACVREGIVALGRRFEPDSLLRETVRLMAGRQATSLVGNEAYQSLATYLPGRPLATAFVVTDAHRSTAGSDPVRSVWDVFPEMKYVVIGMFERQGRIDLTVRGTRVTPAVTRALPERVLKRLRRLPHTTLVASAATVPVEKWLLGVRNNATSKDLLSRYARVLLSLRTMAVGANVALPPMGPSIIFAWDEDFREHRSTPQLALMIESSDARALAKEVGAIAQKLIEVTHSFDPVDVEHTPAVSLGVHLGTPIAHASLAEYARKSMFPIARLFRNVEVSWAAHDGWLILTLSRDHLERILDADVGLAPTLATVRDAHSVWQLGGRQSAVVLVQADATSAVMNDWLVDAANGHPSLLTFDAEAADGKTGGEPTPLGVQVGEATDGVAVVESVDEDSPALGKLRAGDRILGVDGELLDFALPDRDLQRRWTTGGRQAKRLFRVLRGDSVLEIELDGRSRAALSPALARDITTSVQELVDVGRAISFAGVSVLETDKDHFAAMLSLRFAGEVERSVRRVP